MRMLQARRCGSPNAIQDARYISGRLRNGALRIALLLVARIASLLPLLIAFMLPQALLLLVWLVFSLLR
jgi:hypothetical protein